MTKREVVLEVPEVMHEFFEPGVRYRVVHGGRGSVKSWTIGRTLLLMGVQKKLLILCAREFQKSIRDSVHRLLRNQIALLHLESEYVIHETSITNRHNGTEFIFAGLHHNVTGLKSMEGVDICWVEEAETVSALSWEILDPTIRKKGSEIWVSFNPKEDTDPTYKRFVTHPLPGTKTVKVGWKDNPWLPKVLKSQAEHMRENDPELYEHIWGGATWFKNEAQVLNGKWCVKDFSVQPTWTGPYLGADWGFSQDPTALVKSHIEVLNPEDIGKTVQVNCEEVPAPLRRNLYISEEAFAKGCDIASTPTQLGLADLFGQVSESRKYSLIADNARPETISHMIKVEGFMLMEACDKWPGCVEDGVTYLRGFERIFIHPSCTHMAEEARLWSFKVDPLSKKVMRILKPGFEHGWDAVRYSHQHMITRTPTMFDVL